LKNLWENGLCLCVKVWRCGMNVDDEFDIEIRINGLRGKRLGGLATSGKIGIYGNQSNCLFICVCLVCGDEFMMIWNKFNWFNH